MKSLLKIWGKPYNLLESKAFGWWFAVGCTLFCFAFLWVFEPFGLYHLNGWREKMLVIGMYVGGTIFFDVLYFFVLHLFVKKHTVGSTILWMALSLVFIGAINATTHEFIFNYGALRWSTYTYFQWAIFSVAVIPLSALVLIHYNITLRNRLKMAGTLTDNLPKKLQEEGKGAMPIVIHSENKKEEFRMMMRDLLYITSLDNYIDVYFIENEAVAHRLVRYTLAGVEGDNADIKALFRCHKSYIINKQRIESVSGNAAGYRLKLKDCEMQIPVSRKLNKNLSDILAE